MKTLNEIRMQSEIRNAKKVSFSILGFDGEMEMTNEGIDWENDCLIAIDLGGEKLEGKFNFVCKTICMLLDLNDIEFVNVKSER